MTNKTDQDRTQETISMLAKHHGDGGEFAQLMEETFANRFNDEFWRLWESQILPDPSPGSVVIDLGTGPGTFIKTLANKYETLEVYGVECAPYMLNAVGDLPPNAKMTEADLQNPSLPFADESVDAAIASVVVHEMYQPIRMFKEIQRVLKPGARFYNFDWVRASLESYLKRSEINPFDDGISQQALEDVFVHFIEHNRFSLDDLLYMLSNTGFTLLDSGVKNEGQHAWMLVEKSS